MYESSILQLDQLTPHQQEKMGDALDQLRHQERRIVHLKAPAGAGKTFVAQRIVDLLNDREGDWSISLPQRRAVPSLSSGCCGAPTRPTPTMACERIATPSSLFHRRSNWAAYGAARRGQGLDRV